MQLGLISYTQELFSVIYFLFTKIKSGIIAHLPCIIRIDILVTFAGVNSSPSTNTSSATDTWSAYLKIKTWYLIQIYII